MIFESLNPIIQKNQILYTNTQDSQVPYRKVKIFFTVDILVDNLINQSVGGYRQNYPRIYEMFMKNSTNSIFSGGILKFSTF